MNTYTPGQTIVITLVTTDKDGPVDPTGVVCTVRDPTGETSTPPVTKDSVGTYHADVIAVMSGFWQYRWSGAAPAQGAAEGLFHVRESDFV